MTKSVAKKPGFTLIELLVVIAILAVLAAITAGGIFRVRNAQQAAATETTLSKMHVGLYQQMQAVRDQADKEAREGRIPPALVQFALGDLDRAKSLWLYYRMRAEFPETFVEAHGYPNPSGVPSDTRRGFWVRDANGASTLIVPAKATFSRLPASAAAPTNKNEVLLQSAACLYLILTEKGTSGVDFQESAVGSLVGDFPMPGGGMARAIRDTFGTPIGFLRWAKNPEMNAATYLKSRGTLSDPYDPAGKLVRTPWHGTAATSPHRLFLPAYALGLDDFTTDNHLPTLVSAGPNQQFIDNVQLPSDLLSFVKLYDGDNIFSFRLRREGARGD